MTELLNSMTPMTEGFGGFIRPTELERRYGRLMRSPDGHDGDAGAGDGGDGASDAGAGGDAGTDAGATDGGAAAGDAGSDADATTVLGSATADDGAGDKAGDGKGEGEAGKDGAAADSDVPETYELKAFKVGEGDAAQEIEIDASLLESVTPGLKEAGVTQAQLDKLAPIVPTIQEAAIKQMNDQFAATRADWAKQAKADPEIGGKNWDETVRLSAKALDTFGAKSEIVDGKETNEFRKLLNDSGLGNHPVMLKMFRDIGAAASEDGTFVRNTVTTETRQSREEKNYPNDVPKVS